MLASASSICGALCTPIEQQSQGNMSQPGGSGQVSPEPGGVGATVPPGVAPEWVTALQKVIREVANSSNDRAAYKRLRSFSGNLPVPTGEEGFNSCLSHIQETLLTWQIPDEEKWCRLLDVLREPAFEVVRTAKLQNPAITTQQCLKTLQDVFRWPSRSGGPYYEMLSTFQQKGKMVSSYILRC